MSRLLQKEYAYFFSSDVENGAQNVSADGSSFSIQLDRPIDLPKCLDATLEVTTASIWNVSPNISALIGNNKLYVHTDYVVPTPPQATAAPTDFVITIPDGSYGVTDLDQLISREVVKVGYPSNLIQISADDATQKVIITFNYASTWLDFTYADSVRDVLGFNARLVPLTPQAADYSEPADETAAFNRVSSYLLKTDLISNGIAVNNISESIIAEVLITARPGSLINYTPYLPPKADAMELSRHSKNQFSFRLTDQLGRPVELLGESYSFTIVIRYTIEV